MVIYKKCLVCNKVFYWYRSRKRKFCSLDCTNIYRQTHPNKGSFIKGISNNRESSNPMWKENPGLNALHTWVNRHKPKPDFCEDCKLVPPYDLANISQEYKRDINDFEWLCRKCHMKKDGRINGLVEISKSRSKTNLNLNCQNCNNPIIVRLSKFKDGGGKYCSQKCYIFSKKNKRRIIYA